MMKKIIFGIIFGLLLGSTVPAFASVGNQIAAQIVKYSLIINGSPVTSSIDQISYQDTTYVPLRSMAKMFGYDVTFKADSQTIDFTKGSETMTGTVYNTDNPNPKAVEEQKEMDAATAARNAKITVLATPTPTPTQISLDDLNTEIKGVQTEISVLKEFFGKDADQSTKDAISKDESKLADLKAQKAKLYPDTTGGN